VTTGYQKGLRAEALAKLYFRLKGYAVLAERYKTPVGEVDLILKRGKTIVFVEVKLRGKVEEAVESIHARNRVRVSRAAELYLQRHPRYTGYALRFDALALARGKWPAHIVNAWGGS